MKSLFLVLVCLVSSRASADSISCTSADQEFHYSNITSNGGAPRDWTKLVYQGQMQETYSYNDYPQIDWTITNQKTIHKKTSSGTTTTASIGLASGVLRTAGQETPYSKWVICEEVNEPICDMCP